MSTLTGIGKDALARVVAADIPPGSFVNLGIGLPTKISNYLAPGSGVMLHTENGLLGMGPEARGAQVDAAQQLVDRRQFLARHQDASRCLLMATATALASSPRRAAPDNWLSPARRAAEAAGQQGARAVVVLLPSPFGPRIDGPGRRETPFPTFPGRHARILS